jgi:hypothetical protein
MIPTERARQALQKLVTDEPLAQRLHEALEYLRPLRSVRGFDTTIVEMINDAGNPNYNIKDKAKAVAETIATILQLGDKDTFHFD